MTNHVHLVFRSVGEQKPEQLLGDLKRFTSKKIVKTTQENPRESRKEFLLKQFKEEAEKSSNVNGYQFWRRETKPIELWSNKVITEKVNYVHQNPAEAGLVYGPENYVYSSAIDYSRVRELVL